MNFMDAVFNPQYINPAYYRQQQALIAQYNFQQDNEVSKAVHAAREMCRAVKNMDEEHQQIAFLAVLEAAGGEFGW